VLAELLNVRDSPIEIWTEVPAEFAVWYFVSASRALTQINGFWCYNHFSFFI